MWGYRTGDVARLLALDEAEVRRFARDGLVTPRRAARGAFRFSFQDLVLLKAAAGLTRAEVPAWRVRRALKRLRAQLPEGRTLAEVHVSADGDRVVVRHGGAAYEPETGQLLIDFDVVDLARQVAPLVRDGVRGGGPARDADEWYHLGYDLEAAEPEEAVAAYRRALEGASDHAGAHLNLGRLLQARGKPEEAEGHYRAALADPVLGALAAFNLGGVLEDEGREADALEAYRRALAEDPALADAHFNAARLLEKAGRGAEALRHLGAYRRLAGEG